MSHNNNSPLAESGNEIFGTIQEVVKKLEADPNTDWTKVNLEALRQHLLDMKAFTEEVSVKSKQSIPGGVTITVHPESKRASAALKKLFSMHPAMLKQEKNWDMKAEKTDENWKITCTSDSRAAIIKIRALGYIGLIAEGAHHQRHHWMISTGQMDRK